MRVHYHTALQNRLNFISELKRTLRKPTHVNLNEVCLKHRISKSCSTMLVDKGVLSKIHRGVYQFNDSAYTTDIELAHSLFDSSYNNKSKVKTESKKEVVEPLLDEKKNSSRQVNVVTIKVLGIKLYEKTINLK